MLKKIALHPLLLFPLLTVVIFWPLSLQLFTIKNDALTYYYPIRTLISDALQQQELPLWTPFINMGYPLHADLQSGAWNPVIWLFGYFTSYSLGAFHTELLLYLAVGGIGFFYLCRNFGWSKPVSLLLGLAYECSGPVIDSLQFTACISSMAYIPFVFLFFRRMLLLQQPVYNALLTALFYYLLFTGGYPAMFIITCYLLLVWLLHALFTHLRVWMLFKQLILPLALLSLVFVLLAAPALLSFVRHLPLINRGHQQGLAFVLENSMPPACMLSLISPFSTTADTAFFNTNILMRNTYLGIVPLLIVLTALTRNRWWQLPLFRFFLISALVLFGLAWGEYFFLRQMAYYVLPLMDTFRHPALFRFFAVIFLLLAGGIALNQWEKESESNQRISRMVLLTGSILLLAAVYEFVTGFKTLVPHDVDLGQAKNLLHSLTFTQRYILQLPFILLTLGALYWVMKKKKSAWYLLLITCVDLFIATQFNIPVTVIGARSFEATEHFLHRNPQPFPLPASATIEANNAHSLDSSNSIGSFLPYEKRIGRNDYFITPGNLRLQEQFYESAIRETVFKNPVLYFADTTIAPTSIKDVQMGAKGLAVIVSDQLIDKGMATPGDTVTIRHLSANRMEANTESINPRVLVYLQNNYPGWKAFIDDRECPVFMVNISFMGINVPAGRHQVIFRYQPGGISAAWVCSMVTLALLLIFILWATVRRRTFLQ